jgi:hypothetical protein
MQIWGRGALLDHVIAKARNVDHLDPYLAGILDRCHHTWNRGGTPSEGGPVDCSKCPQVHTTRVPYKQTYASRTFDVDRTVADACGCLVLSDNCVLHTMRATVTRRNTERKPRSAWRVPTEKCTLDRSSSSSLPDSLMARSSASYGTQYALQLLDEGRSDFKTRATERRST